MTLPRVRRTIPLLALLASVAAAPAARAQTPAEELDRLWTSVCAGSSSGTSFADRCDEILDAGPGSGDRRSEAARGNNADTLAAQGRGTRSNARGEARLSTGRLSLFAGAGYTWGTWKVTPQERGYDRSVRSVLAGFDWRATERAVLGASIARRDGETDFGASAGRFDTTQYLVTAFAAWGGEGTAVDAFVEAGRTDFDVRRRILYTLITNAGEPDEATVTVDSAAAAAPRGSRLAAGLALRRGLFSRAGTLAAVLRADGVRTTVDPYEETGGAGLSLRVARRRQDSLRGEAGLEWARPLSRGWGVLQPQLRALYGHEFSDDPEATIARFRGDTGNTPIPLRSRLPDRDFARVGGALSATFARGLVAFVDVDALVGHRYEREWRLALGLRKEL